MTTSKFSLPYLRQIIDEYISDIDAPSELNFTVEGYTCTEGDRDYNKMLSEWRASAVKRYMVQQGISEDHGEPSAESVLPEVPE